VRPFVIATRNPEKAREIVEIFSVRAATPLVAAAVDAGDSTTVGFLVATPADAPGALAALVVPPVAPDVAETGDTLEANARIKAVAVGRALGVPALADDTGLEVDALGGAPGVHTARYAGPEATGAQNCARLLADMRERLRASRTARFVTVVVHHDPDSGLDTLGRGKVEGVIVDEPRGDHGFGYDPVFAPAGGHGRTFAEMSSDEKHALSHRGRAVAALARTLTNATEEQ